MPTRDFWNELEKLLGNKATVSERRAIAGLGYGQQYENALDDVDREETLSGATNTLRVLRDAYGDVAPAEEVTGVAGLTDGRWLLLEDLRRAWAESHGRTDYVPSKPLSIGRGVVLGYPLASYVGITVDSMVSLETLITALRQLWPQLRASGAVRRSRPLQERSLALVRFVCLDSSLDATWRERFSEWQKRHPESRYTEVRAFYKDFSRAEESLTGRSHGLSWFYSADARLLDGVRDSAGFAALPEQAKRRARRELRTTLEGIGRKRKAHESGEGSQS